MTIDLAAFAAARRPVQDRGANALEGSVRWALWRKRRGKTAWAGTLVNAAERLMRRVYRRESGKMTSNDFRQDVQKFRTKARDALEKTTGLTDANFESRVEMISRWPDTQAVMCVSDLSAFGALMECVRRGIRVPDDVAIAGFGAYDLAEQSVPSITTIDVGAHEIGIRVAELVLDLLNGRRAPDDRVVLGMTPKVIVRRTA